MHFPTTRYPYVFSDNLLHSFFYVYFNISFPNGSQYLFTSVVINRYRTPHLTSYFLIFGKCGKCGLPPHHLYRDSLSLILNPGPTDFLCKEKVDDCLLEIPTE